MSKLKFCVKHGWDQFFNQGSGIKILGKMGLRDQNNGKKIGINVSRIYHVTTLTSRGRWSQFHHENGNQLSLFLPQKKNDFVLLRETKPKKRFSHRTVSMLHYFFPSYKYFLAEVQVIEQRVSPRKL